MKAKELFAKDKEYIINNGQVQIIDSFSGRVLEGRRFTDGLQQSIEAKEGIQVTSETQIVAKVTYQNLFRLFPKLSVLTHSLTYSLTHSYLLTRSLTHLLTHSLTH